MRYVSQLCFFLVIAAGMPDILQSVLPRESPAHIWAWVFSFISGALTAMLLELLTDLVYGHATEKQDRPSDVDD